MARARARKTAPNPVRNEADVVHSGMVLVGSELRIDALLAVLCGAALVMASLRCFEFLATRYVANTDARVLARLPQRAAQSAPRGRSPGAPVPMDDFKANGHS